MSEDKLQASISRAARAEALLKNELLQEAFSKLEDDYTGGLEDLAGSRSRWTRKTLAGGERARQGERPSHARGRGRPARAASIERLGSQAAIIEDHHGCE
jgi:hypothetical protein